MCPQVLIYDLRSSRPLLVKDHYYGLPIKSLHFHDSLDLVISADSKIIKMWNKDSVSPALLVYFISRRPAVNLQRLTSFLFYLLISGKSVFLHRTAGQHQWCVSLPRLRLVHANRSEATSSFLTDPLKSKFEFRGIRTDRCQHKLCSIFRNDNPSLTGKQTKIINLILLTGRVNLCLILLVHSERVLNETLKTFFCYSEVSYILWMCQTSDLLALCK